MELTPTTRGLQIIFSGFSQTLPLFVRKVLDRLRTYRPSPQTYLRMRDNLLREFSNFNSLQPYQHASYFASLASETLQYPIETLKQILLDDNTNIHQLDDFLQQQLSQGSHGTALILGNINAAQLVSLVEECFPFSPLPLSQRARRLASVYPKDQVTRLVRPEPNNNDDNSAVSFYFQLPSTSPEEYMFLEFLSEVIVVIIIILLFL